ncbi:MAG: MBL fold metallo-hydrolase [Bacilli bacterium]
MAFIIKKFIGKKKSLLLFAFLVSIFMGFFKVPINSEKNNFYGIVTISKENYYVIKDGLSSFYIYEKENDKEVGDILKIEGHLKEIEVEILESAFNFKSYLEDKGIYYQIYVNKIDVIMHSLIPKKLINNYFLNKIDDENKEFVKAILFGDYKNEYFSIKNTQLIFLFSSSGLHFSYVLNIIEKNLRKKLSDNKAKIISLLIFSPIILILDYKVSLMRILFNKIIDIVLNRKNKKYPRLFTLSLSIFIFLLIDYHYVYNLGFILGYLFSLIGVIGNDSFIHLNKLNKKVANFSLFFMLTCVINAVLNYEINLTSQLSLLLLGSVLSVIYLFSSAFYLLTFNKGIVILREVYDFILNCNNKITFIMLLGKVNIIFIFLLILLIFIYVLYIEKKMYSISKITICFFMTLISIQSLPLKIYNKNSISFINVGQGDSILIENNNITILIDTGGSYKLDIATDCLIPFFKKRKIREIDYLLITHNDFDHCGAINSLINNYKVKEIIYKTNYEFTLGNIDFKNLNYNPIQFDSDNNKSLVLLFEFINKTWILMGDAEKEVEEYIMMTYSDIDVDCIKIGHHGSNTSSSEKFIKYISPEEAIISVGKNSYGHPHKETLAALENQNVKIKRTDILGTITYF